MSSGPSRQCPVILFSAACLLLPRRAMAQDAGPATTSPTTMSLTGISSGMPSSSDNAPGDQNSNSTDSSTLVNYYFVFLALILAVAFLGGFFIWRRRRRALIMMRSSREHAVARDVAAWQPDEHGRARWYRQGQWGRSEENLRPEEGLNELGEAPPAYVPKTSEERAQEADGPAVPLQTLHRDEVGLKPPDYMTANSRPTDDGRRSSATEAGSIARHDEGAGRPNNPSGS